MSNPDSGNPPRKASILPQNIEFTPEEEAALDEVWAQIADELHGAPFEADDDEAEAEQDKGNKQQ